MKSRWNQYSFSLLVSSDGVKGNLRWWWFMKMNPKRILCKVQMILMMIWYIYIQFCNFIFSRFTLNDNLVQGEVCLQKHENFLGTQSLWISMVRSAGNVTFTHLHLKCYTLFRRAFSIQFSTVGILSSSFKF